MTNHTEALARVIEDTQGYTGDRSLTLAQAILASPVIAAIRAEERAGIVAWLRSADTPDFDLKTPIAARQFAYTMRLADAIEARQPEGSSHD